MWSILVSATVTSNTSVLLQARDYQSRLRQQHAKTHPRTSWASLKRGQPSKRKAAGESSDEE